MEVKQDEMDWTGSMHRTDEQWVHSFGRKICRPIYMLEDNLKMSLKEAGGGAVDRLSLSQARVACSGLLKTRQRAFSFPER